jgi:hypothetical protein
LEWLRQTWAAGVTRVGKAKPAEDVPRSLGGELVVACRDGKDLFYGIQDAIHLNSVLVDLVGLDPPQPGLDLLLGERVTLTVDYEVHAVNLLEEEYNFLLFSAISWRRGQWLRFRQRVPDPTPEGRGAQNSMICLP